MRKISLFIPMKAHRIFSFCLRPHAWLYLSIAVFSTEGFAQERSYIPNECSTMISCTPGNGTTVLNGAQKCINPYTQKIMIQANWKNNRLQGNFSCWKDDGTPALQATYDNGEFDGQVRRYLSFHKQGQQAGGEWETQMYKHGQREGLQVTPRDDGGRNVRFYHNDKQQGFALLVNADGSIKSYFNCTIDGNPAKADACKTIPIPGYEKAMAERFKEEETKKVAQDNREVVERFANGSVMTRYTLVNGKRDGKLEAFTSNGKPLGVEYYKNGMRQGEGLYYDEASGALAYRIQYKDNLIVEATQFYLNGKPRLTWSRDSSNFALINYRKYDDAGVIREEGSRLAHSGAIDVSLENAGQLQGKIKIFQADGSLVSTQEYDKGRRTGTWTEKKTAILIEEKYDNNVLKSRTIRDLKTQALLRETEYAADGSRLNDKKYPGYAEELEQQK